MQKTDKQATDRRKDYAQRLRVAVRKAHDPLFSLLKTPPDDKSNTPNPR
jgi:hypothetical protein